MGEAVNSLRLYGVVLPEGEEREVYVVDGRITFETPAAATTVLANGFILPGLVDTHAHLSLASPAPRNASANARVRASALAHLEAGVLLVREPGSPDRVSKGLGPKDGLPRIISAGRFLAPPGGYFPGLPLEVTEAELPAAAEAEARWSGAWAKIIGEWGGPDGEFKANYSTEVMAEAARRVHALGARIAVHATTLQTIESAIEADFDSIEHGIGIQSEHIWAMKEKGIAFVPTLSIVPYISDVDVWLEMGVTQAVAEANAGAAVRHHDMVRQAAEVGVLVLAGTDAGMGPHGMIRGEVALLLDAGLSSELALGAASWSAHKFLGLPGIEEGAPADLVAYREDPRRNPEVLAHQELRILDGRIIH